MNENGLINEAKKGDLEAFNRLVLAYQDVVYRQGFYLLGDEDAASDVTQDVFIKAYNALGNFRGGSFKAWLLRTATNTAYDELRRRKRHQDIPLYPTNEDEEENESVHWTIDPSPLPEEIVEHSERVNAVRHLIGTLKPAYQSAVVLIDLQGLDYEEASQVLGVPVGTIKSRLARGRSMLREQILRLDPQWGLLPKASYAR